MVTQMITRERLWVAVSISEVFPQQTGYSQGAD